MARTFGKRSLENLAGVHPTLVRIASEALVTSAVDFTVICGYRNKADQDAAVKAGASKVSYPNSAHNQTDPTTGDPRACAVDFIPYPFTSWEDPAMLTAWKKIADAFFAAAKKQGIKLRWGGGVPDAKFNWDLPHIELHPWRDFAKGK